MTICSGCFHGKWWFFHGKMAIEVDSTLWLWLNIAIKNCHRNSGFTHWKSGCSIAGLDIRGYVKVAMRCVGAYWNEKFHTFCRFSASPRLCSEEVRLQIQKSRGSSACVDWNAFRFSPRPQPENSDGKVPQIWHLGRKTNRKCAGQMWEEESSDPHLMYLNCIYLQLYPPVI